MWVSRSVTIAHVSSCGALLFNMDTPATPLVSAANPVHIGAPCELLLGRSDPRTGPNVVGVELGGFGFISPVLPQTTQALNMLDPLEVPSDLMVMGPLACHEQAMA
jgi:hypothetical protein